MYISGKLMELPHRGRLQSIYIHWGTQTFPFLSQLISIKGTTPEPLYQKSNAHWSERTKKRYNDVS